MGKNLTLVSIPQSIREIGQQAFFQNQISQVIFEEGSQLVEIGQHVFENNNISEIELPASVKRIENYAFGGNVGVVKGYSSTAVATGVYSNIVVIQR